MPKIWPHSRLTFDENTGPAQPTSTRTFSTKSTFDSKVPSPQRRRVPLGNTTNHSRDPGLRFVMQPTMMRTGPKAKPQVAHLTAIDSASAEAASGALAGYRTLMHDQPRQRIHHDQKVPQIDLGDEREQDRLQHLDPFVHHTDAFKPLSAMARVSFGSADHAQHKGLVALDQLSEQVGRTCAREEAALSASRNTSEHLAPPELGLKQGSKPADGHAGNPPTLSVGEGQIDAAQVDEAVQSVLLRLHGVASLAQLPWEQAQALLTGPLPYLVARQLQCE